MDYSKLSAEELRKLLAEKDAALEAAQKAAERKITLKVSELGAISVYGLNARFPLTLYKPQWEKLATLMPDQAISHTYGGSKQPGAAASVARMYHISG